MLQASNQGRSMFSRFAAPHTFGPDLSLGEALVAVAGCLARIFGACVLFAVWGGASAFAWSAIANRFWRVAAEPPLLLLFLAALASLMIAVSAVERSITPRRD
jgi:hypothetical protein